MNNAVTETPDSSRSWLNALCGAVAMVFTFGTPFSYGVLRDPVGEAFDITPLVLSSVFAVMLFAFFIGAATVAVLTVRFPARGVILANTGLVLVLAPALYVVNSAPGVALVLALHGLAVGTVFITLAGVIPRWFNTNRGLATGVIFTGNGLGLFLVPPLWQVTISRFGLHAAFLGISLATAVTFILAGLTCRRPGWTDRTTMTSTEIGAWIATLVDRRPFQLLFLGIGLGFLWYLMFAAYAVDLFVDRGLDSTTASIVFGGVGGISIASRLGSGYIADRIGVRWTYLYSLGIAAVGTLLLLFPQFVTVTLAVICLGVGLGGIAALYTPLLMDAFGQGRDTAVIGVFSVPIGVFALTAPPTVTIVVRYTGSLTPAIVLTLLSTLLAIVLVAAGTRR